MSQKVYDVITSKVIEQIETIGSVPWEKPWNVQPQKSVHGSAYRGVNQLLLSLQAGIAGYDDPRWITFNQTTKLGGKVKKGEKSTPVIFYKRYTKDVVTDGKTEEKEFFSLRYYRVFNVAQVEGIDFEAVTLEGSDWEPLEKAEQLVGQIENPPSIIHGGTQAFYSPKKDVVTIPEKKYFPSPEGYYGTLFHELAHASGHHTRLDRDGIESKAAFGSETYSKEELVAELTASFVCGTIGISTPKSETNSAVYLKGWLSALKNDTSMIVKAASQASKAADWILGS